MNVRIFGYNGLRMIPKHLPQHFSTDSVQTVNEPYLWKQMLATTDLTPVASVAEINDKAVVVKIEVPDGEKIRYEINPPTRAVVASEESPMLAGIDFFNWGDGYTISIIDAANAP